MTSPTPQDVREIAAKAIFDASWSHAGHADWSTVSVGGRTNYLALADAVLAAVSPVIRQQVAEEIAEKIEARSAEIYHDKLGYNDWDAGLVREGLDDAAAIARSHSTQPGEETA